MIEASVEIAAPRERVWRIASDLDAEPRYWKGTKSARRISEEGGVVRREVVIAFRDKRCLQEVTVSPMERVEAVFTGGPITGRKVLALSDSGGGTRLSASWDVRMSGAAGIFTGVVAGHIRRGTEQALRAIKGEAEAAA